MQGMEACKYLLNSVIGQSLNPAQEGARSTAIITGLAYTMQELYMKGHCHRRDGDGLITEAKRFYFPDEVYEPFATES